MSRKARSGSGSSPGCRHDGTRGPRPLNSRDSAPEGAAPEGRVRQQVRADLPKADEERRQLLLGAFGNSLLFSAPGALAFANSASAAVTGGASVATQGQSAAAPSYPLSLPLLRETYGAAGNGRDDDARALATLPAGAGAIVGPGTYRVGSDVEIKGHLWFMPGAALRPDSTVTVTWAPGASITAGDYQIFDDLQGGAFRGTETVGWARSTWFPGGSGKRDLGVQLNNAFRWGFLQIDVPPAPDHTIRTTVQLRHGSTVRCMWHGFPRHVICATDDKPVFEAVGGIRHWRIIGGVFDGAGLDTPSCFLLCARDDATGGQCGDTTALSESHVTGHWGIGVVVSIAAEVLVFSNCNLWIQGRGDTTWRRPGATVTIANADYWGLPYAYGKPNRQPASCSAVVFQNCDLRGGLDGEGSVLLLKGQVEDVSVVGTYLNTVGRCHILCEPSEGSGNWTSPRRLYVGGGGRTETNTGTIWRGVPTVIVDGLDRGGSLSLLTFGELGHFVGSQRNSTPIVKAERSGVLHAFTMHQGGHIEWTDRLIEHRTADLNWADVRCPFKVDIDCGTRALNDCDIKIGGRVVGAIGTGTKVRASNVQNW